MAENEKPELSTGKNDDRKSMEEEENVAGGQKVDADKIRNRMTKQRKTVPANEKWTTP